MIAKVVTITINLKKSSLLKYPTKVLFHFTTRFLGNQLISNYREVSRHSCSFSSVKK